MGRYKGLFLVASSMFSFFLFLLQCSNLFRLDDTRVQFVSFQMEEPPSPFISPLSLDADPSGSLFPDPFFSFLEHSRTPSDCDKDNLL